MNRHLACSRYCQWLFLAPLVLFAGCSLDLENPLSDPEKAKPDEKLIGKWVEDPDGRETFTVEKMTSPGYPPGVMKLILARPPESDQIGLIFCTELNGKTYVHHCGRAVTDPKQLLPWDKMRTQGFGVLKYSEKKDKVTIWTVADETVLENAVKNGKLKGTVRKRGSFDFGPAVKVTDTSAKLAEFVMNNDVKIFWGREMVLRRAK